MTTITRSHESLSEPHPAFLAAERLAPQPETRDEATPERWLRHYAAIGLAAHTAFHDALPGLKPTSEGGSRPDLGYLMEIATAATAAAVAFTSFTVGTARSGEAVAHRLWDLTPEAGALNGEFIDWLADRLDRVAVNPADIDPRFNAADFDSPATGAVAK